MSQSAISNRLNSNFGRVKDKELDLHTKLSIQAKQNALPKGNLSKYDSPKIEDLFIVPKKKTISKTSAVNILKRKAV